MLFNRRLSSFFNVGRSARLELDSPVSDLVYSNNAPTEAEIHTTLELIATAKTKHPCVNSELDRYIYLHEAVLKPWRRLPLELLEEIFDQYFLLVAFHSDTNPYYNCPPFKLLHICRRWRAIALGVSKYWSRLPRVNFVQPTQPLSIKQQCDRLESLIDWSAEAGLSFFYSQGFTGKGCDAILSLLFRHSKRWQRVSLSISEAMCRHFSFVRGKLPALEALDLSIRRTDNLYINMFDQAPRLRQVRLCVYPWSGKIDLPWSQLTIYRETSPSVEIAFLPRVLTEAQDNLTALHFKPSRLGDIETLLSQLCDLQLPALTSLCLRSITDPEFLSVLAKMTLPALQHLTLHSIGLANLTKSVVPLIHRSNCDLRFLSLHSASNFNTIEVLKLTPSLRGLDLNSLSASLVDALVADEDGSRSWMLVSKLETMTIYEDNALQQFGEIPRLVAARCESTTRLSPSRSPDRSSNALSYSHSRPLDLAVFTRASSHYLEDLVLPLNRSVERKRCFFAAKMVVDEEVLHSQNMPFTSQNSRKSKHEREAELIQRFDHFLKLLEGLEVDEDTVAYIYYERITVSLWKLYLTEPLAPQQKREYGQRLEALLRRWGGIMDSSEIRLQWLWDSKGFLRYVPVSEIQRPQVTTFFLDRDTPKMFSRHTT